MQISYNFLQKHFKDKLPGPEKLAELLTMHSQEVEGIEKKNDDYLLDVKILPSRAYDYIDHLGIIRDISAILKIKAEIKEPEPKDREIIFVKIADFEKVLGAEIPEKEIVDILENLGMEVKKNNEVLSVGILSERPDLKIKEDIIEEVARVYGYDKIEEKAPEGLLVPPKRNDNYFFAGAVRNILIGLGFTEVYNYSFAKEGDFELENPPAKGKEFLRTNLTEGLKNNLKENGKYFKDIKIFEIGRIFPQSGEAISLAAAISNGKGFYVMKGVVDAVLDGLGIDEHYYEDAAKEGVADIRIGNTDIGAVDHNTFELNFEELAKLADENVEYRPVSKYPAIVRDIALFVPLNAKVENVLDAIENTAGDLLEDTDLFDIYEREDDKSLAFHLIFQAKDRTLTDEEVNKIMEKIFTAIEANPDWEVRK